MILVTLGTQDKTFERLLKIIDQAIEEKIITDEVIVQAGFTKYKSKNMKIFDFCSQKKLEKLIKECKLLITHGGVGSIVLGLNNNKKIIAVPRLSKYKEHTNDHQKQIIEKFSKASYILALNEHDNFEEVYKQTKNFKPKKYVDNSDKIIKVINDYLEKVL